MRFTAAILAAVALLTATMVTTGSAASNSLDVESNGGADSASSPSATLIVEIDMVDGNSRFGLLAVHATVARKSLVERLAVVDGVTESRQLKLFLEDSVAIVEG
ncbi:MAG: hypothetical protein ACKVIY_17440, partial [Acidimicrobiales bacterium]